jgi:hypothetical protein
MSQPSPNDGLDPDDLPDLTLVLLGHELDVVVFQKHLTLAEGVTIHFQPENIIKYLICYMIISAMNKF